MEMVKLGENGQDVLPICLEALLHHASIESFGKDIVRLNALPLLSEIHNRHRNDVNINVALSRIISYLSFHKEILEGLYTTGKTEVKYFFPLRVTFCEYKIRSFGFIRKIAN